MKINKNKTIITFLVIIILLIIASPAFASTPSYEVFDAEDTMIHDYSLESEVNFDDDQWTDVLVKTNQTTYVFFRTKHH